MNKRGYLASQDYIKMLVFAGFVVLLLKLFIFTNITTTPINKTPTEMVQELQQSYDDAKLNLTECSKQYSLCESRADLEALQKKLDDKNGFITVLLVLLCLALLATIIIPTVLTPEIKRAKQQLEIAKEENIILKSKHKKK